MPVYEGTIPSINMEQVREYAAQRGQGDADDAVVSEACTTALRLAAPKGVFQQGYYDAASHHILCSAPFKLKSEQIVPYLKQARILLMAAVTIGPAVEEEIDKRFLNQDVAGGIVLDSAAAVATGQLLDQLTHHINEICEPKGYKILWRVSPGTADWPIGQQMDLANAAGGGQIGLAVTAGGMLSPRKTLTALFGLVPTEEGCGGSCSSCSMSGCCGSC